MVVVVTVKRTLLLVPKPTLTQKGLWTKVSETLNLNAYIRNENVQIHCARS